MSVAPLGGPCRRRRPARVMAVTTEQGKVNIVERLPSEHNVRTIVTGVDYDIAVSVVKYLARPTLRLVYTESGEVASWAR